MIDVHGQENADKLAEEIVEYCRLYPERFYEQLLDNDDVIQVARLLDKFNADIYGCLEATCAIDVPDFVETNLDDIYDLVMDGYLNISWKGENK